MNQFLTTPILALLLAVWATAGPAAEPLPIKIGMLSFRTAEQTRAQWAPTAKYLDRNIPEYHFEMVPMNYPTMERTIADKSIDFVLTNTAHSVSLEAKLGITRILTMVSPWWLPSMVIHSRSLAASFSPLATTVTSIILPIFAEKDFWRLGSIL